LLRIYATRFLTCYRAGLPYKKVTGVGAAAVDDMPQTGQRVLPDVRMLMRSQRAQCCLVNPHDDVSQRHGAKTHRFRRSSDDTAKSAAMKLGHARYETQPAGQAKHDQTGSQAQQRVGCGPCVGNKTR
jgi:hypothetical protein